MSAAKRALSRGQIIGAAGALLDRDGPDSFTMRRLGAELGVDPMAVYYHLPNKAAVYDAVVDDLWAGAIIELPRDASDWQTLAAETARALRRRLIARPNLVALVATRPAVTANLLTLTDRVVGDLHQAGLPPASAMRLLDCLVAYTVGKVQQEVRQPVGGSAEPPEEVYQAMTPETFPNLVAAMSSGYDWDPEGEFELGLAALVAGWRPAPDE